VILLVLGVLIWSAVHLLPSAGASVRAGLVERLGEDKYKGLFALSIVVSVVLMVFGWRSTDPSPVYTTPAWSILVSDVLMFVALLLFLASALPTNLKRVLRHPQLTGVAIWAGAHLLSNGDTRSLVLFGGIGAWAVVAMLAVNQRDGAWRKPEPLPLSAELKPLVAAIVAFVVLFLVHPWIAGVSPMPR
jgi:uncharacterized membrane protein